MIACVLRFHRGAFRATLERSSEGRAMTTAPRPRGSASDACLMKLYQRDSAEAATCGRYWRSFIAAMASRAIWPDFPPAGCSNDDERPRLKRRRRPMPTDPRHLTTVLTQAYGARHSAVLKFAQPRIMGWVCIEVLDGIDARARADPASPIAAKHRRLLELLGGGQLVESAPLRDEFTQL